MPFSGIVGVRADAVIFLLLGDADVETLALLREDVEQQRLLVVLGEIERLDQLRQIVAVDRAVVGEAHLLENQARAMAGGEQALDHALGLERELLAGLAGETLHELFHAAMQVLVARIGDDVGEVFRDGADVLVDGPLVVVEDDDEPLGVRGDIVERLVGDAAGEGRVAAERDDVLACRPCRSRAVAMPSAAESAVPA